MTRVDDKSPQGRRRRRGRGRGSRSPGTPTSEPSPSDPREWQWRTFPVFFAFSAGVVVMGILVGLPGIGAAMFIAGLFLVALGVVHMIRVKIVADRARRK